MLVFLLLLAVGWGAVLIKRLRERVDGLEEHVQLLSEQLGMLHRTQSDWERAQRQRLPVQSLQETAARAGPMPSGKEHEPLPASSVRAPAPDAMEASVQADLLPNPGWSGDERALSPQTHSLQTSSPAVTSASAPALAPQASDQGWDSGFGDAQTQNRADTPRPGLRELVKDWFTTGNLPVKVGMLVLLAGLAALLRYASTQGWVSLPMWARLAGVAALALGALGFGWRERERKPSFAVALQGGALGALLLTVFAAFKLYGLMGPGLAFGLSALLIAAVATMATLQNALPLAVISVLAGFLAPIWLSTGSGNHVALFSYYALLNAGILAMAWSRPWRLLNLLGFGFTWGIGVIWGVLDYTSAKLASTQPFLLLFFAFYLALPILYTRKAPVREGDRLDACLLFGTPLIAFSLQAGLLDGARGPLAGIAVLLAGLYAALARALQHRPRYAVLASAHWVLAVGFGTLAVPLAFSAKVTGSVFAVEGAALIWLGLRQGRQLPQWTGAALQGLSSMVLLFGWFRGSVLDSWREWLSVLPERQAVMPVFNASFMSGLLLAVSVWASAWLYAKVRRSAPAAMAYGWGLLCWTLLCMLEIDHHVPTAWQVPAGLIWAGLTAWLAAEMAGRGRLPEPQPALAWTGLAALLLAFWLAPAQSGPPLAGWGVIAWALFATFMLRTMQVFRELLVPWAVRMHGAALALLPWVLAWSIGRAMPESWQQTAWEPLAHAVPWLGLSLGIMLHWRRLSWPVGQAADANRPVAQRVSLVLLGGWWLLALLNNGSAPPLPWLPLLNPLDLVQVACLALWLRALRPPSAAPELALPDGLQAWRTQRAPVFVAGALVLATVMTLRGVHHWGGLPWNEHIWLAPAAQTALTVVWSVLGMVCWVQGSRRAHRRLWLLGAALMGGVLIKLLLVDRQNLGDLLGIGAFMAYGLLCTLVGWLAPAPPREDMSDPAAQ